MTRKLYKKIQLILVLLFIVYTYFSLTSEMHQKKEFVTINISNELIQDVMKEVLANILVDITNNEGTKFKSFNTFEKGSKTAMNDVMLTTFYVIRYDSSFMHPDLKRMQKNDPNDKVLLIKKEQPARYNQIKDHIINEIDGMSRGKKYIPFKHVYYYSYLSIRILLSTITFILFLQAVHHLFVKRLIKEKTF